MRVRRRGLAAVAVAALVGMVGSLAGASTAQAETPSPAVEFVDVPVNAPFRAEIQWLYGQGITRGWATPDGLGFKPVTPVSRQAMAAFLYRAAGSPAFPVSPVSPFADVPVGAPFYKEISWLYATGVATGTVTPDGRLFQPTAPVSRQAVAAFLYRIAGQLPGAIPGLPSVPNLPSVPGLPSIPGLPTLTDVPVGSPFYTEITWLLQNGITTGYDVVGGPVFNPTAPVSRQAVAAFFHRVSSLLQQALVVCAPEYAGSTPGQLAPFAPEIIDALVTCQALPELPSA